MSIEAEQQQDATEVVETVVDEAAPNTDAPTEAPDAEAAFAAGFSNEEPVKEPPAEPAPQTVVLTAEELADLKAKAAEIDKLKEREQRIYGTLGSLKQSIDQLRNQPRPSATAVQVTKANLSKLSEMFPEMADALAQDLNGVLHTGSVDPAQFEQAVENRLNERLQQTQQMFETKVLSVVHPDWRQIVPSEDFQRWKQNLPEEVRTELDNSWDAEFIGSKLSEFKDWKGKATQGQQAKQRRLEAAITPRGNAQMPAPTEDDAFLMGFKKARGLA